MVYDLSSLVPFVLVFAVLALVGSLASIVVLGQSLARHHRTRVARHQSIPTYYRRLVLAH